MKTQDLLPKLSNENEVFAEVTTENGKRGLFRRRLITDRRGFPVGVETELLATFQARIIGVAVAGDDENNQLLWRYTVAVKSKYGAKIINLPSRAFDGSGNGTRLFLKTLYRSGLTGVAYPGHANATVRACVALTREGVPMP